MNDEDINNENLCECDEDDTEQIITIFLDDGKEVKCNVLELINVEDKEYIILLPFDDDNLLIYEYIEAEDKSFELLNIDDDKEFQTVHNIVFEMFEDFLGQEGEEEEEEYTYGSYEDEKDEKDKN